jgi:hypothetical protein
MYIATHLKWNSVADFLAYKPPVEEEGYLYHGEMGRLGSGGDSTAEMAEAESAAFQSQLVGIFQQQYNNQQQLMQSVKPYLQAEVTNPTGLSAAGLASERTQATDVAAGQTQNAQKAAGAQIAMHGGAALPSGVGAQIEGGIAESGAAETAAAQQNITAQNEQLKLSNFWRGIGGLTGQAELENPQSYASAANQASGETASLSQAVTQSQLAGSEEIGGIMSGIGGLAAGAGKMMTGMGDLP